MEVLDKYIALLDELGKDFLAVGGLGVERQRFLVGIELKEIIARAIGIKLEFLTGGVADARTFYLYDFGSEPRKKLCTGRT